MRKFNELTDTQLVLSFQEGNSSALEALISRYKEKLFSSILFIVKDRYLAEDLFQETFVRIIDTLRSKRYNEEGKFLPWAMRIAHNLCVDYFRKVKRTPAIVTNDNKDVFDLIVIVNENAEQKIIKQQGYDRMHHMLSALPEEQREVIVLRHFGEMSFKEIAKITNCSINTALGRMRYGLINLRKMMMEKQVTL